MKKRLLSSLLALVLIFSFAIPAFAGVSSFEFDISKGGGKSALQYINVNSNGSVEFSVSGNMGSSWTLKIELQNRSSGAKVTRTISANNNSARITNLKAGQYLISVLNNDSQRREGTLNFSWDGNWGDFVN